MINLTVKESLEDLNYIEAQQYIGGVIFVAVVMVVGIVGNLHVLFVYTFCIPQSNHRIFILVLGVLDFITCTVGMPFILVDLRNPLTFTVSSVCKILRFTNYFTCSSSALILVVIAVDRYRKICVPHGKQITPTTAKVTCFLVLLLGILMSWPAPILFGITNVQTSDPNINGSRCYTESIENVAKYQGLFNTWLIVVIAVSFCILVIMYTLIWREIMRRTRLKYEQNRISSSISSTSLNASNTNATVECIGRNVSNEMNTLPERNEEIRPEAEKRVSCTDHAQNARKNRCDPFDRKRKTTVIFVLLTAIYFLSFFPHLILKIVTFMKRDFLLNLKFQEKVVYNTFIWCFFINNMANCFVYGCFDARFRRELGRIYKRIICRT